METISRNKFVAARVLDHATQMSSRGQYTAFHALSRRDGTTVVQSRDMGAWG